MNDDGYATAEAAVALPALMVVLALAVSAVVCVGAELSCVDAARAAARVAARGDTDAAARSAGLQVGPHDARLVIDHRGQDVRVEVTATVRPTRWLPGLPLHATAVAEVEPR